MSAPAPLVLRDVHVPPAPAWWPPAPGWWLVLLAVAVLVAVPLLWRARRRRRRARWLRLFEAECSSALPPPEQVAAASQLLRRAARRVDPRADRLQGAAWLQFLMVRRDMPSAKMWVRCCSTVAIARAWIRDRCRRCARWPRRASCS